MRTHVRYQYDPRPSFSNLRHTSVVKTRKIVESSQNEPELGSTRVRSAATFATRFERSVRATRMAMNSSGDKLPVWVRAANFFALGTFWKNPKQLRRSLGRPARAT